MKIIITESQYNLILENEEYLGQIMDLIETFDVDNINLAFQIAKGLKIKQSTILEHYKELFKLFKYVPSVINLKKITSKSTLFVRDNYSKKTIELLFKLPNVKYIQFSKLNEGDLDNLVSTNKDIYIYSSCEITSIPNLTSVGTLVITSPQFKSLPKLKEVEDELQLNRTSIESLPNLVSVGTYLQLIQTPIESLPNLKEVRVLYIEHTPLAEKLKKSGMSVDEIKNKFGVIRNLDL